MTPEKPAPISRRERPAKPALTRQGIIDAALAILRDEGLGKVTMRRIAAALDTGPASLYVYVRNTGDLHAQILDSLLGPVKAPEAGTWRDRLKALLVSYGEVLFRHPEIARMAMSTQPSGPNYLALADAILGLLDEGGVSGREAAWAMDLLLLHPTAVAVEHSSPKSATQESDEFSALAAKIATADPARYPHIARLGDTLVSGDGPSRADWALDVILDGVLAAASRASAEQRGW
ncbi:TetR/AcrR family transcriptional regulator [Streptomyces mirabilis]|uniref:TetR/AcrR family transcriptional regulator n=1 Tax=Streptomyces mirabilis TaxID=68239 RepID=UPI00324CA63E